MWERTYIDKNDEVWLQLQSKYPVGSFLDGTVVAHTARGVYFDISEQILGYVDRTNISVESASVEPEGYPAIGTKHRLYVLCYDDDEGCEYKEMCLDMRVALYDI